MSKVWPFIWVLSLDYDFEGIWGLSRCGFNFTESRCLPLGPYKGVCVSSVDPASHSGANHQGNKGSRYVEITVFQVGGVECSMCPKIFFNQNLAMFQQSCQKDLRVEFLLKTDSGYPRDAEVPLFALANPEYSLRFNTHWSAPPVSVLARSGGPRKISQSPVSRNSNIERRMDRPRAVVGVIRGVA